MSKTSPDLNRSGFLLWKASNAWQRQVKTALAPAGITHVQFLLLETLDALPADKKVSSQAEIARLAGIDVMMTSKVMRLLVRKKLVERRSPRNDARAFAVVLTPAGKKLLAKARPLVEKNEDAFFAEIEKRKKFVANLESLTAE